MTCVQCEYAGVAGDESGYESSSYTASSDTASVQYECAGAVAGLSGA